MGREIRRVPPNWEHPRVKCTHSPWAGGCDDAKKHGGMCYQPLYDESFADVARKWKDDYAAWERGERPEYCSEEFGRLEYWEYDGNPPSRDYYRPSWQPEDATWYQVYETVSEGTPVSPPFATQNELIEYLVEHGDFWDERRGDKGWSRNAAEHFVKSAPSLIVSEHGVESGVEGMAHDKGSPK